MCLVQVPFPPGSVPLLWLGPGTELRDRKGAWKAKCPEVTRKARAEPCVPSLGCRTRLRVPCLCELPSPTLRLKAGCRIPAPAGSEAFQPPTRIAICCVQGPSSPRNAGPALLTKQGYRNRQGSTLLYNAAFLGFIRNSAYF